MPLAIGERPPLAIGKRPPGTPGMPLAMGARAPGTPGMPFAIGAPGAAGALTPGLLIRVHEEMRNHELKRDLGQSDVGKLVRRQDRELIIGDGIVGLFGGVVQSEGSGLAWVLDVGKCSTNTKLITLPCEGMVVFEQPLNEQQPHWTDTFEVEVRDKACYISRSDRLDAGWGQYLKLEVAFPGDAGHCVSTPEVFGWDHDLNAKIPITLVDRFKRQARRSGARRRNTGRRGSASMPAGQRFAPCGSAATLAEPFVPRSWKTILENFIT